MKSLSRVWLLATPWTAAYQAPPSMGFSRQEYWSGMPLPSLKSRARLCNLVHWTSWAKSDSIWLGMMNLSNLYEYRVITCAAVLSHSVVSDSLWPHGLWPASLLCLWDSPVKNTGVGCHALLQGIFLVQGLNPCLLHLQQWQTDSLPLAWMHHL